MAYLDTTGLNTLWTKIKNTFYVKASSGIPKTDLATAVQTSLGLADTSLQSLPSHTHDDRYYTETEMDTKLADKVGASVSGTKLTLS